jgi:hypothetical protein
MPFALILERTYEALIRDRVKFKVGRIVYIAFSRDETDPRRPRRWSVRAAS